MVSDRGSASPELGAVPELGMVAVDPRSGLASRSASTRDLLGGQASCFVILAAPLANLSRWTTAVTSDHSLRAVLATRPDLGRRSSRRHGRSNNHTIIGTC